MRPTSSGHRLLLGLPGYLILFAPPAFAPERQRRARTLPSPSVFFLISTHFTAPPGIPCPSLALKSRRLPTLPDSRGNFHPTRARPPACPLRPVIPENARPLRITAAAGT